MEQERRVGKSALLRAVPPRRKKMRADRRHVGTARNAISFRAASPRHARLCPPYINIKQENVT
jgi:hypothetical protein